MLRTDHVLTFQLSIYFLVHPHLHNPLIGDTINDIGLGVNAGIISIGVTWGYNSKELLSSAGASYLVNDSIELSKLMKTICP